MRDNIKKLEVVGGVLVALFCSIVLGCSGAFAADLRVYQVEMDSPDDFVDGNIVVRYQYDPDHEEEVLDEDSNVILSIDPEDDGEGEGEDSPVSPEDNGSNSNGQPSEVEDPFVEEKSDIVDNIRNANTFDSITVKIVAAIVCVISASLFIYNLFAKRRIRGGFGFVAIAVFGLILATSILSHADSKAVSPKKYIAAEDAPTLYQTITDMSINTVDSIEGPGYYTDPYVFADPEPVTVKLYGNSTYGINDFVVFADKCWRPIRTSSNGTKLMYYGERDGFGACVVAKSNDSSLNLSQDEIFESHGFYTYNENMSGPVLLSRQRSDFDLYSSDYPFVLGYRESDCYKKLLAGDYNGEGMSISGNNVVCDAYDPGILYYSSSASFSNGHYYLYGGGTQEAQVIGSLTCTNYANGCTDSNISFSRGSDPRYIANLSDSFSTKRFSNFFCTSARGAVDLGDSTIDCGESIEVHSNNYVAHYGPMSGFDESKSIDSPIKNRVEEWFESNHLTEYQDKMVDEPFCGNFDPNYFGLGSSMIEEDGASMVGMSAYFSSNFENYCSDYDKYSVSEDNGNGLLRYPVGLLSPDELGAIGAWDNTIDKDNGAYTITLVPSSISDVSGSAAYDTFSNNNGNVRHESSDLSFLPVITVNKDIKIAAGIGSSKVPFVLDGENYAKVPRRMATLYIEEDALFEGLIDNYSLDADYYSFSYDEEAHTITVDISRPINLNLAHYGIKNISPLKYLKIPYLDLTDNEISILPKDFPYETSQIEVSQNHIRDLSPLLHQIDSSNDTRMFIQDITVYYSDPDDIETPPAFRQFLDFIEQYGEDDYWDYLYTSNFNFGADFTSGQVPNPSKASHFWLGMLTSVTY